MTATKVILYLIKSLWCKVIAYLMFTICPHILPRHLIVLGSVISLQGVTETTVPEVFHDNLDAKTFNLCKSVFVAIKSKAHSFFPSLSLNTLFCFLLTQSMTFRNVDEILISVPLYVIGFFP